MIKNSIIRLRLIYKILLSISIFLAGICLIIGCISIYYQGNGYSREIVNNVFSKINIPIFICLAFIVGDIIWEFISPTKKHVKITNKKHTNENTSVDNKNTNVIRLVILGVAVIALIFGACFGGYADVLTKAINICTECIGLG